MKKLSKNKAREIARKLAPIVEDYIPAWDRDYQKVTIKFLSEALLYDLKATQETLKEILDNANDLEDSDTVKAICGSAVWDYEEI